MEVGDTSFGQVETYDAESADGTLIIIVCRAKHLPNRRKLDKQSPYVALRLGTTAKKTPAHHRAGQIPEWAHEIRFELTRDRKPIVKLDVLDETKHEPTPIGSTEIDCSVVFSSEENFQLGKYIYDRWYELTSNGRRAGLIYLEMTFYPRAPVVPPKIDNTSAMFNRSGYGQNDKVLPPPPPQHPSKSKAPSTLDEVFESSLDQKRHQKRLSFLKNSLTSGRVPEETEQPTQSTEPEEKALKSKFNKLMSKFLSKEAISNLWGSHDKEREADELAFSSRRSSISEYHTQTPTAYEDNDANHSLELPEVPPHRSSDYEVFSEILKGHFEDYPAYHYGASRETGNARAKNDSPRRKPPPSRPLHYTSQAVERKPVSNTSIPFSADTIGADEDENDNRALPTRVYLLDKPIKSLTYVGKNKDIEFDNGEDIKPQFHAPTPGEHFSKIDREQRNKRVPLVNDIVNEETGYMGNGSWKESSKFSPSIFDRMPKHNDENNGFENKPHVPPKIPKGLTAKEYYVLERDSYLKDINGRRL